MARRWAMRSTDYTGSENVVISNTCFSITVTNYGSISVFLNKIELLPSPGVGFIGGSVSFSDPRDGQSYLHARMVQLDIPVGFTGKVTIMELYDIA